MEREYGRRKRKGMSQNEIVDRMCTVVTVLFTASSSAIKRLQEGRRGGKGERDGRGREERGQVQREEDRSACHGMKTTQHE